MRTQLEGWEGDTSLVVGELYGYRAWRLTVTTDTGSVELRLRSLSYDNSWPAGDTTSRCLRSDHCACCPDDIPPHTWPVKKCGCGYWAYYGVDQYSVAPGRLDQVDGVIAGYGHCVRGTRGFRAEKARIVAVYQRPEVTARLERIADSPRGLWPSPDAARAVLVAGIGTLLARTYPGVPVYDDRDAMLAAHPLTPPPTATQGAETRETA